MEYYFFFFFIPLIKDVDFITYMQITFKLNDPFIMLEDIDIILYDPFFLIPSILVQYTFS